MADGPDISRLAALLGDPARANILTALMAGRALTAGECAAEAGVSAPTTSGHLAQLVASGLVLVSIQGRHRYYRLAGPEVAEAIEAMMGLAARVGLNRTRVGPRDPSLRAARMCYDHLAGAVATELYDALITAGFLAPAPAGLTLTPLGRERLAAEGLPVDTPANSRRPLCRACLDWSERRDHLAGALGAAIAALALERGWCQRTPSSRAVTVTTEGRRQLLALAEPRSAQQLVQPAPQTRHLAHTAGSKQGACNVRRS
ncbi:MAG: helix-turn-helix transcriptional regulator [Alphaproteobacteria bacterium]|nr:helix-turn-helix transcriptional regulator [Alphaproteobacteria bacterium]